MFSWEFSSSDESSRPQGKPPRYNVSLWDIAGQNEYQSAHSLFYTKRTMYLLYVNLKAYAAALAATGGASDASAGNSEVDRFVEQHIYHWVRVICAHVPGSEVVFVGTKADLIGHDAGTIRDIASDFFARIQRKEAQIVRRLKLQNSTSERVAAASSGSSDSDAAGIVRDEIAALKRLVESRPRFLSNELHVMSSADLHGLEDMRAVLQRLIVESNTSFQMPAVYSEVGVYLRSKVDKDRPISTQIHDAFVSAEKLKQEITSNSAFADLTDADITAIVHVLHCLGDVLWFDESSQLLSTIVFISPAMVIDFIRQVVNHTLGEETDAMRTRLSDRTKKLLAAVRDEGRIAHELLERLDLWSQIDDSQLMLQLKELLFHFKLAYPAAGRGLEWNSDLTVPIYWKKRHPNDSVAPQEPELQVLTEHTCWQYEFKMHLPEGLFEKFGVQSYSAHFSRHRAFTCDSFDTISDNECHVRVSKQHQSDDDDGHYVATLSTSVWAASRELLWHQLFLFVMNLEKLLDTYPGLWVTRSVLASDGKGFDHQELIVAFHENHAVGPASLARCCRRTWTGTRNGSGGSPWTSRRRASPTARRRTSKLLRT